MRTMQTNSGLRGLRLALLGTIGGVLFAAPALAQDASADEDGSGNEIIVTAQKREQNVQDVPISMSVISGDTLSDMGIKDMTEIDRFVPNFFVQSTPGNNAFYLRGIGTPPGSLAFEQTVGLFVDGIYGGHARQFIAPFVDVERVEVLRGPQGALVGKNTSAGAISVINKKPGDKLEASVEYSREFEIGGNRALGILSGPLSDSFKARVAVQYDDSEGYLTNATLGGKEPTRKSLYGRGTFVFDPGQGVDATLKVEGGYVRTVGTGSERLTNPAIDPDLIRDSSGFVGSGLAPTFTKDFDNTDAFNTTLTVNFEIGGGHTLTSISGYSHFKMLKNLDSDFGPAKTFGQEFAENFDQFSQEIRLASSTDKPLEYIVGAYFHTNDYYLRSRVGLATSSTNRQFWQNNSALSFYGSATYKFTDALRLIGSVRYTSEKKSANQTRDVAGPTQATFLSTPLSGKLSEGQVDPSATLQFDVTPDAMLYASYSQGSKVGGFIGGQGTTTQAQFYIRPETSETFELGAKLAMLDRRLRFNIAAFQTTFNDLQVSSYDATIAAFITLNAGKARSKGVEADMSFNLADGINLVGQVAYLDAKYLNFPGAPCFFGDTVCPTNATTRAANNSAGRVLPRSPKWSGTVSLDLVKPAGGIELFGNVGVTFRSFAFLEDSYNPLGGQVAHQKIDARLGVRAEGGRWELALIGKNLTNEITASHAFATPSAATIVSKYIQPPRTIAVQAKVSF